MANIRSISSSDPDERPGSLVQVGEPLLSWCWHPAEELQLVYGGGQQPLPGRRLCGLCGELVFLAPR